MNCSKLEIASSVLSKCTYSENKNGNVNKGFVWISFWNFYVLDDMLISKYWDEIRQLFICFKQL